MKDIRTKAELKALAKELKVRKSWHEPDEQGVEARVFGECFDNAGFYGTRTLARHFKDNDIFNETIRDLEMWVTLYQDGAAVAEINLAILFAFACDTYEG
jgi:hypothetical protein